jgi:hypothetical protein
MVCDIGALICVSSCRTLYPRFFRVTVSGDVFAEIENWPKVSDVYSDLRWSGFPWTAQSCILGSIHYPHPLPLRYVMEKCEPSCWSAIWHMAEGGFATHRNIRFERGQGRTWVEVDA